MSTTTTLVSEDYLYGLEVWGGFFEKENVLMHTVDPKQYENIVFFKDKDTRDTILHSLRGIEKDMLAKGYYTCKFVESLSEGYHINIPVICHRVCEYKGKRVHTQHKMHAGTSIKHAMYFMNNNWFPNHNDYPFGPGEILDEDYFKITGQKVYDDLYESDDFRIIQEWVTGAFDLIQYGEEE